MSIWLAYNLDTKYFGYLCTLCMRECDSGNWTFSKAAHTEGTYEPNVRCDKCNRRLYLPQEK